MTLLNKNEIKQTGSFKMVTMTSLIMFLLAQVIILPIALILIANVPVVGSIVNYLVGGINALEQSSEIFRLEQELSTQKQRNVVIEKANEKLTESLTLIENSHPELFDENHEVKENNIRWKIVVAAAVALILGGIFFYRGSDTAAIIDGGVAIINESDRMNAVRYEALSDRLDAVTNHLITQDAVLSNTARETTVTRSGIGNIINMLAGEADTQVVSSLPGPQRVPTLTFDNLPTDLETPSGTAFERGTSLGTTSMGSNQPDLR